LLGSFIIIMPLGTLNPFLFSSLSVYTIIEYETIMKLVNHETIRMITWLLNY